MYYSSENVENMSVGDEVATFGSYYSRYSTDIKIVKIVKLTKTQITISGGRKFRRDTGFGIGKNNYETIKVVTDYHRNEVRKGLSISEIKSELSNIDFNIQDADYLESLLKLLKESKQD